MITQYHKIALVAAFGLALAFTFSCSSDDGEDSTGNSSGAVISSSSENNGSSSSSGGSSSSEMGSSSSSDTPSSSSLPSSSSQVIVPVYGDPIFDTRDGQIYQTVVIGGRTWMARNLNHATGGKCGKGSSLSDENTTSCDTYGRLYDWETAKSICPSGWHLPSRAEWETLIDVVGGESIAGARLKSKSGWNSDGNGTDDYGFSALPGGACLGGNKFEYVGSIGAWWTATDMGYNNFAAYAFSMANSETSVLGLPNTKNGTFNSVRCVKN